MCSFYYKAQLLSGVRVCVHACKNDKMENTVSADIRSTAPLLSLSFFYFFLPVVKPYSGMDDWAEESAPMKEYPSANPGMLFPKASSVRP